jgi:hypothetical protein
VLVAGRVVEDGEVVGGTEVREVEEDTIDTMAIEGEETRVSFCSILKLMFTNGKIIVYKFMIQFYSYLYFCQSYT